MTRDQAIEQLRAALTNEGPSPSMHRRVAARHRAEWPTLWAAIDQLLHPSTVDIEPRRFRSPHRPSQPPGGVVTPPKSRCTYIGTDGDGLRQAGVLSDAPVGVAFTVAVRMLDKGWTDLVITDSSGQEVAGIQNLGTAARPHYEAWMAT